MHECVDCGRKIKGKMSRCILCQCKLRRAGICIECGGDKPTKSKRSKYCEDCQKIAIDKRMKLTAPDERRRSYRGPGHKENTYDTKRGGNR